MKSLMTREGHLSDLTLERFIAGEFQGHPEDAAIRAHLDECAVSRARYEALCAHEHEFELMPPQTVIDRDGPWFKRTTVVAPVLALAAAMVFFVYRPQSADINPAHKAVLAPDTFRIKGGFDVEFFVKGTSEAKRAEPNQTVYPGDRLGFRVSTRESGHLIIAGMDAQASPYLCYPQNTQGQGKAMTPTKTPVTLDQAIELDDVLGDETFVALFCEAPVDFAQVSQVLKARGSDTLTHPGALLPKCRQRVLKLQKVARDTP